MIRLSRILVLGAFVLTTALHQSDHVTTAQPLSSRNDVTAFVEQLGNPFTEHFSSEEAAYARNVWDMQVFDGRLYLGSGNSNNEPPAANAGPVNVWYYDAAQDEFGFDYTVDDEQIDQFSVFDGRFFIPGHDRRGSGSTGNIYSLNQGMWVKLDNVPDALHVYDIYLYGGRWFAAIGNDPSDGYAVVSSADSGQTWQKHYLPVAEQGQNLLGIARAWEFFEVGDDLLVSVLPPSRPELSGDSLSSEMTYYIGGSPVYRLVDGVEPQFEEVTDIDFFGGFSTFAQGWMEGRVARPVRYGLLTVYLGVDTTTDHNWTPFGLFSVDEAYQVRQYMLMENAHIWDLLVEDGILYALAAQPANNQYIVGVYATCDLTTWTEALRFNAPTFARSFALYQGDFYFGEGTEASPLSAQAGNILRVSGSHFEANVPDCALQGMADATN